MSKWEKMKTKKPKKSAKDIEEDIRPDVEEVEVTEVKMTAVTHEAM